MEWHLIHRAVDHWQATQYRVHNRRWIAFDNERDTIWKQVMEIYRQSRNWLYWRDAHDNRMRYIAQPHLHHICPCESLYIGAARIRWFDSKAGNVWVWPPSALRFFMTTDDFRMYAEAQQAQQSSIHRMKVYFRQ